MRTGGKAGGSRDKASSRKQLGASLQRLEARTVRCTRCPRLRDYCRTVAAEKRRAFRDWTYWGRPVPGFGDPRARLYILGLAPAAHGANRTGRVFTGDRSGDFLFSALARNGFANQGTSVSRDDGLVLTDAWVAAAVRCAPPANKPLPRETENCRAFLSEELALLGRVRTVLALGKFAHDAYLRHLQSQGVSLTLARFPFAHGAEHALPAGPRLVDTYHPSQQNTFTGKLTPRDLDRVLARIARGLDGSPA
jgi:uracil-DNA glycosylase family 4